MSKLTEELRQIRVFNDHGFFNDGGDRVYIGYAPATTGLGSRAGYWSVHRFIDGQEIKTDPDAHWRDYGHKTFSAYGNKKRADALAEAQAWAGERFGITEWTRSPFGGYGDTAFVKARLKALRESLASREENDRG